MEENAEPRSVTGKKKKQPQQLLGCADLPTEAERPLSEHQLLENPVPSGKHEAAGARNCCSATPGAATTLQMNIKNWEKP